MSSLESLQAPLLLAAIASVALGALEPEASAPEPLRPMGAATAAEPVTAFEPVGPRLGPAASEPGVAPAWAASLEPVAARVRATPACLGCPPR